MAVQSTDERILEFKKTFNLSNNGKDGLVTTKKFGDIMRSLGHIPTNVELQVIKNELHYYAGGYLQWYLEVLSEIMFYRFDEDNNNFISVEEFSHFKTELDNHETNFEEAKNIVSSNDIDGDGQLDIDEFINILILHLVQKGVSPTEQKRFSRRFPNRRAYKDSTSDSNQ
ncbi:hypothetical protein TSUD_153440 [Trifolium subterraneum]|uniref:EF-hand domain-containing protein n=1 Tax=Trifolium subterraneum TaxID=3900 RepID=A0A2Z6NHT9_TRISU|nr:hypothetical protein TSUD_153440 [Trifolium subterraneum]